jgi:hypothetical protein
MLTQYSQVTDQPGFLPNVFMNRTTEAGNFDIVKHTSAVPQESAHCGRFVAGQFERRVLPKIGHNPPMRNAILELLQGTPR